MTEIRRIDQTEAGAVAGLWDRMCRETPNGGPLTRRGLTNITRMLALASFHRDTACLVAVDGDAVIGYAVARVDAGDGLLPGLVGELQELYVQPEAAGLGASGALAEAAIGWLRERGAMTIRKLICADNAEARLFWQARGFDADMVCLSLYPPD